MSKFILAKAYRGELVPQGMNDEPASELLKRFKAKTKNNQTPYKRPSNGVRPQFIPEERNVANGTTPILVCRGRLWWHR